MSILYPSSQFNYGWVPGQESKLFYLPGELFYSDTDAAAAEAAAGAVAATSAVCIYYVFIEGALRAPLYVHNEIHTAEAAATAPAAAPAAAASVSEYFV